MNIKSDLFKVSKHNAAKIARETLYIFTDQF